MPGPSPVGLAAGSLPSGIWQAVTPSDATNFTSGDGACRALYVGGAGNITAVDTVGNVVLFTAPPVGTVLNIRAVRVNATGTTATALVALF